MSSTWLSSNVNPKKYIPRQYLNLLHKAKYTDKYSNCIKCLALGKRRQVNIRCSVEICHRYLCAEHFDEWHIENAHGFITEYDGEKINVWKKF